MLMSTEQVRTTSRPLTGDEYLESLRSPREIWIYGEQVKDLTTHPAFRNPARMIARLYDSLHDPAHQATLTCPTDTGSGGFTHRYFRAPKSVEDLVGDRDAIAEWARLTYGWVGRTPDYKAAFLATLGANADFYAPYDENARRWYKEAQEQVLFLNHAIVHPPVDRNRPPDEVSDVYVHVERETDRGLIISGAKVVATGSALTHYNFIAPVGFLPVKDQTSMALVCIAAMDSPGVKLICRPSYAMTAEVMGSPFDYPLSSRLDENDAILVFDHALIPWENVLINGDVDRANNFFPQSGFLPRAMLHGCTRLAVKLDFITGLLIKAVEETGTREYYGVKAALGEAVAWRNLFWGLSDAMVRNPIPWADGAVLPNPDPASAYRVFATIAYPRVKEIVQNTVASGLVYLNSHAVDFQTKELRPYLDKYLRGSSSSAVERVKLMKLLWDAVGTEFGGRHELYERNYSGSNDLIRIQTLEGAMATGQVDRMKEFAEQCMAEYDLDGWTVPDLITPNDVNVIMKNRAKKQ